MRVRTSLLPAFVLAVVASAGAVAEEGRSAKLWLEKMSEAVEYLNYQGTIVYMQPGMAETFRVFHRVENARVTERLVALDGAGAEIIRNPRELICIFPDQKKVVVEKRRGVFKKNGPLASLPAYHMSLARYYSLEITGRDRLLGRPVVVLSIDPRDEYRYGYRLWLDRETALPLKSQLIGDPSEMPIEEIRFTSLSLPPVVPEEAVRPAVDTADFEWTRQVDKPKAAPVSAEGVSWRSTRTPRGFMLAMGTMEYAHSRPDPRLHLVYSDGLASVSVFVDTAVAAAEQVEGPSMVGASNAYSVVRERMLITAMGAVPPQTVRIMAISTRPTPTKR